MNTIIIYCAKYLIVVSVIIAAIWFLKLSKHEKKQAFWFGLITLPLAYILAKIGSHFYFDPRPFVVGNFTPLIVHAADNGFPSDHTLLASAIAATVMCFNRRLGIALWVIAVVIGIARVMTGVHHPIDIVGSLVIASIAGSIAHFTLRKAKVIQ